MVGRAQGTRFAWFNAINSEGCALPPTASHVLCSLFKFMNESGHCFPSIARLAACTRLSERTVMRAIQAAERAGWLIVARTRGSDGRTHNEYRASFAAGFSASVSEKVDEADGSHVTECHPARDTVSPEHSMESTSIDTSYQNSFVEPKISDFQDKTPTAKRQAVPIRNGWYLRESNAPAPGMRAIHDELLPGLSFQSTWGDFVADKAGESSRNWLKAFETWCQHKRRMGDHLRAKNYAKTDDDWTAGIDDWGLGVKITSDHSWADGL